MSIQTRQKSPGRADPRSEAVDRRGAAGNGAGGGGEAGGRGARGGAGPRRVPHHHLPSAHQRRGPRAVKRRTLEVGPGSEGLPVQRLVRQQLQLSDAEAQALIARGAVYLDGRRCRDGGARLRVKQKVTVVLEESG